MLHRSAQTLARDATNLLVSSDLGFGGVTTIVDLKQRPIQDETAKRLIFIFARALLSKHWLELSTCLDTRIY